MSVKSIVTISDSVLQYRDYRVGVAHSIINNKLQVQNKPKTRHLPGRL